MSHGRQNFVNNCCRITISLWMLILYGWQKILENITCGYGHHLWKYWIYHSWPLATRDKSNIFTRDNHNHSWYFPIFFPSHLLLSQCSILFDGKILIYFWRVVYFNIISLYARNVYTFTFKRFFFREITRRRRAMMMMLINNKTANIII